MSVAQTIAEEQLETLASTFGGALLRPSDEGYEDARRIHNGLIDRRPALIARCTGASDVAAAVRFGREAGLPIAVRGGGHNVAGRCVVDDGVVIDLSAMKGIHVDPDAAPPAPRAASPGPSLTARRPSSGLPSPAARSRALASPGTRSAAGSAG